MRRHRLRGRCESARDRFARQRAVRIAAVRRPFEKRELRRLPEQPLEIALADLVDAGISARRGEHVQLLADEVRDRGRPCRRRAAQCAVDLRIHRSTEDRLPRHRGIVAVDAERGVHAEEKERELIAILAPFRCEHRVRGAQLNGRRQRRGIDRRHRERRIEVEVGRGNEARAREHRRGDRGAAREPLRVRARPPIAARARCDIGCASQISARAREVTEEAVDRMHEEPHAAGRRRRAGVRGAAFCVGLAAFAPAGRRFGHVETRAF